MESFFKKSIISKENKKKSDSRGKEKKYFSRPTPVNKGKKVSSVKKTSLTPKKKGRKTSCQKKQKLSDPKSRKTQFIKKIPFIKETVRKKPLDSTREKT